MIQMRVTPEEAKALIGVIPHKMCQKGAQKYWVTGGAAGVKAQSICWLYCWAETGMNSLEAAHHAQLAFNQIFDKSYKWFAARVPHEWARNARYKDGDYIESELIQKLESSPT
jgi:hypothetical protein